MTNLPCECQELKPKGETNSSFLVLHPLSGVHIVKTVGSHLKFQSVVIPNGMIAHLYGPGQWVSLPLIISFSRVK